MKCVFKGETNGVGSILDYSAMHLHKDDDEKFRGDLEWMRLGDRKKSIETNAHYYTVAVSNFDTSNGRPLKGPISDARPVKNSDTAVRRFELIFEWLFWLKLVIQEGGGITSLVLHTLWNTQLRVFTLDFTFRFLIPQLYGMSI